MGLGRGRTFRVELGPFLEGFEYLARVPSIFPAVVRNQKKTRLNGSFKYLWRIVQ